MKMKKTVMTNIKTLAAIFVAAATFTACSSESDNEITCQQILPNENYLLSVTATKGGGAEYTRALAIEDGKPNVIKATWDHTTEHVYVKYQTGEAAYAWCQNALTPSVSEQTANLVGYLRGSDFRVGTKLKLFFPNKNERTYEGQIGTLEDIAANFDYQESSELEIDGVSGNAIALKNLSGAVTFTPQQAIVKFYLKTSGGDFIPNFSKLSVKKDGTEIATVEGDNISPNDGVFVAIPGGTGSYQLEATVGNSQYNSAAQTLSFTNGKYYIYNVEMN